MLTPLLLSFTQLYIMNTHKRTRMSAATPNAAESQTQSESQRSRTSRNYAHSNVQSGVSVATTAHSSSASSATQPIELSSDSSDTSDSDCQDHDSDSIDDSDGSDSDSDSDSDSENHGDAPISELQRTVSPSPTAAAEVATHAVNDTCNNFGIDAAELNGRYELLSRLGRGSYGEVYKARDVRTGELVAIKRIHDIFSNQINAKRLLREIKLLRHMQHPNIIRFHGLLCPVQLPAFNTLLLVFELMDTDLSKILASSKQAAQHRVQHSAAVLASLTSNVIVFVPFAAAVAWLCCVQIKRSAICTYSISAINCCLHVTICTHVTLCIEISSKQQTHTRILCTACVLFILLSLGVCYKGHVAAMPTGLLLSR